MTLKLFDKEIYKIDWLYEKYLYSRIGKPNQKCGCPFESGPILDIQPFNDDDMVSVKSVNWKNDCPIEFNEQDFRFSGITPTVPETTEVPISFEATIKFEFNAKKLFDFLFKDETLTFEILPADLPLLIELEANPLYLPTEESDTEFDVLLQQFNFNSDILDEKIWELFLDDKVLKKYFKVEMTDETDKYRIDVQANHWMFNSSDYPGSPVDYPEIFDDAKDSYCSFNQAKFCLQDLDKLELEVVISKKCLLKIVKGFGEINCLEPRCTHINDSYSNKSFVMSLEGGSADIVRSRYT